MVFLHTIKTGRGIVNRISTVPSSEWFRTRPDFKMSVFCIPFIKQKQKKQKKKKERKEKKKKRKKENLTGGKMISFNSQTAPNEFSTGCKNWTGHIVHTGRLRV